MDSNPFVEWVDTWGKFPKRKTFFIPSYKALNNIYRDLEVDRKAFDRIPVELAQAYVKLWDKDNFAANGIKIVGKKVNGIPLADVRARFNTYQYIDGLLTTPELSEKLFGFLSNKYDFSDQYRDILQTIAAGNLTGKDLISFCGTNKKIKEFCERNDQEMFKKAILSEFKLDWNVNNFGKTPKELYIELHRGFYAIVLTGIKNTGRKFYAVMKNDRISKEDLIIHIIFCRPVAPRSNIARVFFFPKMPELSFYAELGVRGNIVSLQNTEMVSSYMSREELYHFIIRNVYKTSVDDEKLDWYEEIVGRPSEGCYVFNIF